MASAPGSNGRTPRESVVLYWDRWASRRATGAKPEQADSRSDADRSRRRRDAVTGYFGVLWDSVLDAFKTFVETAAASDDPVRHRATIRRPAERPPGPEPLTCRSEPPMNFAEFSQLPDLSDEEFLAELANIRPYTACILKHGPNFEPPGPDHTNGVTKIIWQHGKRNTALHRAGLPVTPTRRAVQAEQAAQPG
jgi:hypothetical protein